MFRKLLKDFRRLPEFDRVWLVIWAIIYVVFLGLDIALPGFWGASLVKYAGIFLCLVYAYQKFPGDHLLILALLFTLLSDTILIWTDWEIAGVYAFCFAQFFHTARLSKTHPKFLIFYFFATFLIFALTVSQGVAPIYAVSMIYAASLLTNVGLSIRWYREEEHNFAARCAFYGFLLFLACDVNVGLQHLALDGVLPSLILPVVGFLVWMFYYPAQIFIANSSNFVLETVAKKKNIK